MCLLIVKPEGILLNDLSALCHDATSANPDGFGIARMNGDRIRVSKGMATADEQIKQLKKLGSQSAIIHWRFGTSGSRAKLNCHPFRLPDGSVFAHNGVLPIESIPGLSDTHTIAKAASHADELEEWLRPYVSRGNKFAMMRPSSPIITIMGEEFGTWRDNSWLSNLSWEWSRFGNWKSQSSNASTDCDDSVRELIDCFGIESIRESLSRLESESSLPCDWSNWK